MHTIPGAPQARCISQGGSVGPHALGLAPACPGASATDQRSCHPREAQCRALAWGCVIYASPVWGGMGTGGLFLSLVPTEDHSFGLVLVK